MKVLFLSFPSVDIILELNCHLDRRESIKLIPLERAAHAHRMKPDPCLLGTQKVARMSDVSVIVEWFLRGTL